MLCNTSDSSDRIGSSLHRYTYTDQDPVAMPEQAGRQTGERPRTKLKSTHLPLNERICAKNAHEGKLGTSR